MFHPRVHVTVSWFGCKIGHFICYLLFNIWYYIFDFKFEMVQLFLTIQYIFMYGYFFCYLITLILIECSNVSSNIQTKHVPIVEET